MIFVHIIACVECWIGLALQWRWGQRGRRRRLLVVGWRRIFAVPSSLVYRLRGMERGRTVKYCTFSKYLHTTCTMYTVHSTLFTFGEGECVLHYPEFRVQNMVYILSVECVRRKFRSVPQPFIHPSIRPSIRLILSCIMHDVWSVCVRLLPTANCQLLFSFI